MIVIWIPRILVTFSALVVVVVVVAVASGHASVLIKIISSLIRVYSRKKKPGTTGSDWMSSNEIVNYLSYSRHAGFVESWKITCHMLRSELKKCLPAAIMSSWVSSFKFKTLIFINDIRNLYLKKLGKKFKIKFYMIFYMILTHTNATIFDF